MRLRPRRGPDDRVLLLCFALDDNFLSHRLFPAAPRLRVRPEADPTALAKALPRRCRLAIQCINLTEPFRLLPPDSPLRAALARRGIPLLNGGVASHAKRDLHALLRGLGLPCAAASEEGPPDELLMVKSNQNSGALVERGLDEAARRRLGLDAVPDHVPRHASYPVLPRRDVPHAWFSDSSLAVERYLRGDSVASYRLFVAGQHAQLYVRASQAAVVRGGNSSVLHQVSLVARGAGWTGVLPALPHLPAALAAAWQVARAAGLEFGAIDILEDAAGRPHVVDINTTPYFDPEAKFGPDLLTHLRAGIQPIIG